MNKIKEIFKGACFEVHMMRDSDNTGATTYEVFESWWEENGSAVVEKLNESFWIEGEPEEPGDYFVVVILPGEAILYSFDSWNTDKLGYGYWQKYNSDVVAFASIPEYEEKEG